MRKKSPRTKTQKDGTDKTSQIDVQVKRSGQELLDWYDRHRRVLPWRALPSETPDPYHVWLSEIMLQQTVVKAVIPYFLYFVEKWPTVHDLAKADQEDVMNAWAGLGYYARARNLHKCAKIISQEFEGIFPAEQKELKNLPGIGEYTSAAITAIASNKPATVVDGNVERVMARLYAVTEPLSDCKKQLRQYTAEYADIFSHRSGDLAQSMMDLGATICIAKAPRCVLCPLKGYCQAYKKGIAEQLPVKKARKEKPEKHGYIYCITDDKGHILLHKRPEKGLLGGMSGFPTSEWTTQNSPKTHPDLIYEIEKSSKNAIKICNKTKVFHSFTHFNLELTGCFLEIQDKDTISINKNEWQWMARNRLNKNIFPTVFRKFYQFL